MMCAFEIRPTRFIAASGNATLPHGEPCRSHHCQNMNANFIAFASFLSSIKEFAYINIAPLPRVKKLFQKGMI